MNNKEKIWPWQPIEGLANKVHIYSVCNDTKGFRVILTEDNNTTRKVLMNFAGTVRSYRETDDLISLHLLEGNAEPFENEEPHSWALFKVTDSEYLKWASHNSGIAKIEDIGLMHYVVWTEDATLEILSWAKPKVEFIQQQID